MHNWALAAAVLAIFASVPAVPLYAAADSSTDPVRLEAVKRALERAREDEAALQKRAAAQTAHLDRLKRRLVDIAAITRRLDNQIQAKDAALETLFAREAKTAAALAGRRAELTRLLAALQRLARQPVRAGMVIGAAAPLPTLRGGMLLRYAVPSLDHDARTLAAELRALARLRRNIAHEQLERDAVQVALSAERRALAALIGERRRLERRWRRASVAAEVKAKHLAAEAEGIEQLLARIAQAQKGAGLRPDDLQAAPKAAVSLVVSRGARASFSPLPAVGKVIKSFGAKSRGTTVRTRPAADVLAPRAGRIVFAGPFRGYGRLLIIQHAGGYHILLAGLARLDAGLGDEVLAGEPIGAMGSQSGGANHLYIELRHSGRPINPLPWLAANSNKVSG